MFYIYANGKSIYQPADSNLVLFSPQLTLEMGKAGSLQFQMPPNHRYYDALTPLSTVITVEMDDTEIFRGRVLNNDRNFNKIRTVYCEGNLAYLVDSVQKAERYEGTTHELFKLFIAYHNARMNAEKQFTVGDITIDNREIILAGKSDETTDADTGEIDYKQISINSVVDDWQTSFDLIETCLIDYTGGYLRTRYEDGVTYIDLLADYGTTATQEIEFGKNLLDLTEETAVDELFTVLIPLGDNNLTIESVNNGSDELVDEDAVAKYGRIVKTHVFDSVNDPSTLLENGQRYLKDYTDTKTTITVKAVDMHLIDSDVFAIHVGDKVYIRSIPHGMTDALTCTKIEYDFSNPANNTYTFGDAKQTLTERYRKDKTQSNNSGSRGGGGSGGSAGEAAEEESDKKLEELYKAYIDVNNETGNITLAALYEKYKDTVTILQNQCGIDLSAGPESTNVNITTLRTELDEQKNLVQQNSANIRVLNEADKTQIELVAAVNKQEEEHYAEIIAKVGEVGTDGGGKSLQSQILLKADQTTLDGKITNINSKITNINSEITNVKQLIADEINALKVDTDWLESMIAKISAIKSNHITTARLFVSENGYAMYNGSYSPIATNAYVDSKCTGFATQTWVENKGYLTAVPTSLNVTALYASTTLTLGGQSVATRAWVVQKLEEYAASDHTHTWDSITDKPSSFKPASHTHSFSGSTTLGWGHTHKTSSTFKAGSNTGGVYNYSSKTISISGTTGKN